MHFLVVFCICDCLFFTDVVKHTRMDFHMLSKGLNSIVTRSTQKMWGKHCFGDTGITLNSWRSEENLNGLQDTSNNSEK